MAFSQTASFQGLPLVGLDFVLRRGTKPCAARMRVPHDQDIAAQVGDLVIEGEEQITLKDCIPDLATIRYEHRSTTPQGGSKREFSVQVWDRRKTWADKPVSGGLPNRRFRDNSRITATERTADQLCDAALTAVGEPTGTNAFTNAYPTYVANKLPASEALDWLCSILPLHVVRRKNDTYAVEKTGQGDTINAEWPYRIPDFGAALESGPKKILVVCDPTWYGCGLELEAVGLDEDGQWKLLNDLSYLPAQGWENEWPTLFSGVSEGPRSLALSTVFRCYRLKAPQTMPFSGVSPISDITLVDLDDYRLVTGAVWPPRAYVSGTWWPYTDHFRNTANCPIYAADFRISHGERIVVFDYPVFKAGECIAAADLKLHTSFRLRDAETGEMYREVFEIERNTGSGQQMLKLDFLWRARSIYYTDCNQANENDNLTSLQTEAQVYLDAWKSHWDTVVNKRDVPLAGIWNVSLSGNIAQVNYRVARGLVSKTRVTQHYLPTGA